MTCPYDATTLKEEGNDSRQEWSETFYSCPMCKKTFTRRTTYKTQSCLIANDVLTDDETGRELE